MKKQMMNVLVIDDKEEARQTITDILEGERGKSICEMYQAEDERQTLEVIKNSIDIVFLDVWFGGTTKGLGILEKIRIEYPSIEIIMVTTDSTPGLIRSVVDKGVLSFVKKPFKKDDILIAFEIAKRLRERNRAREIQDARLAKAYEWTHEIIGISPSIVKTRKCIENVGKCRDVTVLIRGESGTGKELVARAIHKEYGDLKRPFIPVNCGAISKDLFESELFGHEKGSFTGAEVKKLGLFELADNGDIFLDEIAEIPSDAQAKLLRVLDGNGFRPVGGTTLSLPQFRLLCATNRNLEALVREHKFREDLYHRICVYEIELPPLRERKEDILPLTEALLEKISIRRGIPQKCCSEEVIEYFLSQDWPGNVRTLKNVLEIMVINSPTKELKLKDLPCARRDRLKRGSFKTPTLPREEIYDSLYEESKGHGLYTVLEGVEKYIMERAIENNKNYAQAASAIGTTRVSFHNKMKKYRLHDTV